MYAQKLALVASVLLVSLLVLMGGCVQESSPGGEAGGYGIGVPPLELPTRIELTRIEDDGTSQARAYRTGRAYDDSGTDYDLQEKHSWVEDSHALRIVNDILNATANSGYENFVNAGPYKALVPEVGGDDKGSQSGPSGNDKYL